MSKTFAHKLFLLKSRVLQTPFVQKNNNVLLPVYLKNQLTYNFKKQKKFVYSYFFFYKKKLFTFANKSLKLSFYVTRVNKKKDHAKYRYRFRFTSKKLKRKYLLHFKYYDLMLKKF